LIETHGLPAWSVLTIFVVATILLGLMLGILLILFIDCVCPPKKYEEVIKEISVNFIIFSFFLLKYLNNFKSEGRC